MEKNLINTTRNVHKREGSDDFPAKIRLNLNSPNSIEETPVEIEIKNVTITRNATLFELKDNTGH